MGKNGGILAEFKLTQAAGDSKDGFHNCIVEEKKADQKANSLISKRKINKHPLVFLQNLNCHLHNVFIKKKKKKKKKLKKSVDGEIMKILYK